MPHHLLSNASGHGRFRPASTAGPWWPTPLKILLVMLVFYAVRVLQPWDNYYPLLWPDGWGYLLPALRWIKDGSLETIYGRTFGYPAFLAMVLQTTKSFLALGLVQTALNLAGGWLMLWVMASLARAPGDRIKLVLSWGFILGFIWLIVTSPLVKRYEHMIQPEAIAPFVMGCFIFGAWLLARRMIQGEPHGWPLFLLALVCALAYFHKPNWGLGVLAPLLLLALLKLAYGSKLLRPAATYLVLLALVFAPLLLAQRYLSRHDPTAVTFLPKTLFTWHLQGIKPLLEADLQKSDPPFDRALLVSIDQMLDHQFELDKKRQIFYPSLGYNPDDIFYSPEGYAAVPALQKLTPQEQRSFFLHYFFEYALTEPGMYLRKIFRQLAVFYNFKAQVYWASEYRELGEVRNVLKDRDNLAPGGAGSLPFVQDYFRALQRKLDQSMILWTKLTLFKTLVYQALRFTYYPVMIALLAVFAWLVFFKRRRGREPSPQALRCSLMALTCFGTALLVDLSVAMLHSLDVGRYFYYHFGLTIASQWLGFMTIAFLLVDSWRSPSAKTVA